MTPDQIHIAGIEWTESAILTRLRRLGVIDPTPHDAAEVWRAYRRKLSTHPLINRLMDQAASEYADERRREQAKPNGIHRWNNLTKEQPR